MMEKMMAARDNVSMVLFKDINFLEFSSGPHMPLLLLS